TFPRFRRESLQAIPCQFCAVSTSMIHEIAEGDGTGCFRVRYMRRQDQFRVRVHCPDEIEHEYCEIRIQVRGAPQLIVRSFLVRETNVEVRRRPMPLRKI